MSVVKTKKLQILYWQNKSAIFIYTSHLSRNFNLKRESKVIHRANIYETGSIEIIIWTLKLKQMFRY